MKKFENIMIASDIDGTYIWHGGMENDRNEERIKYFIENGGRFAFSSGRNHKDIYMIIPNLKELCNMPCVLCNGAYCYDAQTDTISNPTYLDGKTTLEFLHRIDDISRDRIGWRITDRGGFLIREEDEVIKESMRKMNMLGLSTRIVPFDKFDGEGYFKVVFTSDDIPYMLDVFEQMKKEFPMFGYTRSAVHLMELLPHGISKASQLKYLKSTYEEKYGKMRLCGIGDFDNDRDMLLASDIAMCPENATDGIKEICGVRLCHAKYGAVADAIDKIEEIMDGERSL
ncbi:MAG: HAD hydrolase family protein [Clostridia bacterium]|nr:HAD hydrolase family protein [Clostridia bacterium]